jgi:hypothetical protein
MTDSPDSLSEAETQHHYSRRGNWQLWLKMMIHAASNDLLLRSGSRRNVPDVIYHSATLPRLCAQLQAPAATDFRWCLREDAVI